MNLNDENSNELRTRLEGIIKKSKAQKEVLEKILHHITKQDERDKDPVKANNNKNK